MSYQIEDIFISDKKHREIISGILSCLRGKGLTVDSARLLLDEAKEKLGETPLE